jgi:hypothetical protein
VTEPPDEDRFTAFDIVLKPRGRSRWKWSVRTIDGHAVRSGSECSRGAEAERALFLLVCANSSQLPKSPLETDLVRSSHRRSKDTVKPC